MGGAELGGLGRIEWGRLGATLNSMRRAALGWWTSDFKSPAQDRQAVDARVGARERTCSHACAHVRARVPELAPKTLWPSGLRRWLKAPVRKGVGSSPTGVMSPSIHALARQDWHDCFASACALWCLGRSCAEGCWAFARGLQGLPAPASQARLCEALLKCAGPAARISHAGPKARRSQGGSNSRP